jgi:hypothetical protein
MLVVKIEVWPWGSEDLKREIGVAEIVNTSRESSEVGDYEVTLRLGGVVYAQAEISNYARTAEGGVPRPPWDLVRLALNAAHKARIATLLPSLCGECPRVLHKVLAGERERVLYCNHPDAPEDHQLLGVNGKPPAWCPLREELDGK